MLKRKSDKLDGLKIALCVTGSIAAIEAPKLARELVRHGADVTAYMSADACKILHPNALEFATGKEVVLELTGKLEHLVDYDLLIVAPATATTMGKLAHGIADTPVTALLLSSTAKALLAPAMHASMYGNPFITENVKKLKETGYAVVEPIILEESAKMATIEDIVETAIAMLHKKDLSGLRVLVTAGATIEYLDPVRIITNKSSGKMGLALAKEAYYRGAEVTLLLGHASVVPPDYLRVIRVETGMEMLRAVEEEIPSADVFISAAAVSDFTVKKEPKKIGSRREHALALIPVPKILGRVKEAECIKVGFKALHNVSEDELIRAASESLREHNLDLMVANDVSKNIFGSEETEVYLVDKKGVEHVPRIMKSEAATRILDAVVKLKRKNEG